MILKNEASWTKQMRLYWFHSTKDDEFFNVLPWPILFFELIDENVFDLFVPNEHYSPVMNKKLSACNALKVDY